MIGITEIIGEVVKTAALNYGKSITYVFGNAEYVKEQLDVYSQDPTIPKLPLIALFCPVEEKRGEVGYVSAATINLIIACSTTRELTNEQREEASFKQILRPIYNHFLNALKSDDRFDFGYKPIIKHVYSENYSYGRYGAYTPNQQAVSEPIDAIDIRNLEIKIKEFNTCRK